MLPRPRAFACAFVLVLVLVLVTVQVPFLHCFPSHSWSGVVRDAAGNPVGMATVKLMSGVNKREYSATTSTSGEFTFIAVTAGDYTVTVSATGKIWTAVDPVIFKDSGARTSD